MHTLSLLAATFLVGSYPLISAIPLAADGPNIVASPATSSSSSSSTSTSTPTSLPPSSPIPSYTPGWCTFHLTQWQRNENGIKDQYVLDLTLYDGGHNPIATVDHTAVTPLIPTTFDPTTFSMWTRNLAQAIKDWGGWGRLDVPSPLEKQLTLYTGSNDMAELMFSYGRDMMETQFGQGPRRCSLGNGQRYNIMEDNGADGYEGGKREGDCGFSC